jgi:hypothetical protein
MLISLIAKFPPTNYGQTHMIFILLLTCLHPATHMSLYCYSHDLYPTTHMSSSCYSHVSILLLT